MNKVKTFVHNYYSALMLFLLIMATFALKGSGQS